MAVNEDGLHHLNGTLDYGVASSAGQIEGGILSHNWDDWCKQGRIKDRTTYSRANDFRRLWRGDIDMMADMGIKTYRFSIEWSRVEPEQGVYNQEETDWYRELLMYMKSKGIMPLLTLHHFTTPMWFEKMGAFEKPDNIPVFLGFVAYAVKQFGDMVNEYVTINEPNVFASEGYFNGVFPPGKRSYKLACRVQSVMASCHVHAYILIHKLRKEMGYDDTKVGFANHLRVFKPKNPGNPWHRFCASLTGHAFQGTLTNACLLGRFRLPLIAYGGIKPGEYADFLGINYYSCSSVSKIGGNDQDGAYKNDLDWDIYPEGIRQCAESQYKVLQRPVYITENGACDNHDTFRCLFIYDHLKALLSSDLPIQRYYYWSFTDNFEWAEGESSRFGLVHVDYETQKRTIKKSGRFYSEIIKNNGVTEEMYKEYVEPQKYPARACCV